MAEKTPVAAKSQTALLLKRYRLTAKKNLGQNFLIDPKIAEGIISAAQLEAGELVIEIGPGLGALTELIAEKAAVTAIELDRTLAELLKKRFAGSPQVEIISGDALTVDFDALAAARGFTEYKVIANLPYYITTPLVMRILEKTQNWTSLILMMQKEVADRLAAPPGGKDCGAISLAVQYRAQVEKLFIVPPQAFLPSPAVFSTVARFFKLKQPPVSPVDEDLFFSTIAAAFGQRRKTLLNSLSNSGMREKDFWQQCLAACGVDGQRRGETLSLEEYCCLSDYCSEQSK